MVLNSGSGRECEPGAEFGKAISVDKVSMAVSAPADNSGSVFLCVSCREIISSYHPGTMSTHLSYRLLAWPRRKIMHHGRG